MARAPKLSNVWAAMTVAVVALACGAGADAGDTPDASGGDVSAEVTMPGLPHRAMYEALQQTALAFAQPGGDWSDDFGDAAYYGPAFFRGAGISYGRADYEVLADAGVSHDLDLLRQASADTAFFFDHLEEGLMAAFGV